MLLPSKSTRMISTTSPLQVSTFQNLATLQHSTAQGAQNRPSVQYSAAQTAQNTQKISNLPPTAPTAQSMPKLQNSFARGGTQCAQNTRKISILAPSISPMQIQLRPGIKSAGSQIFFPQECAQNWSNLHYSAA